MINFRKFVENKDLYGFTSSIPESEVINDLPIQSIDIDVLMDLVAETKLPDIHRPFSNVIHWGSNPGAIRIRLTPNQAIIIERMTIDFKGKTTWIAKKLFKIKTHEYAHKEEIIADDIQEHILNIAKTPFDVPTQGFKRLLSLTKEIASNVRNSNPYFKVRDIRKINENNYQIIMNVSSHGIGDISGNYRGGPIFEAVIDMSYNDETGLIKAIFQTVEKSSWVIDIPYWISEFTPTQSDKEISKILATAVNNV